MGSKTLKWIGGFTAVGLLLKGGIIFSDIQKLMDGTITTVLNTDMATQTFITIMLILLFSALTFIAGSILDRICNCWTENNMENKSK